MTNADDEKIEAFAKELQKLAQQEKYEQLAQKLPTAEQLADFMQIMFSQPKVVQKFEEEVLQRKST